MTTAQKIIKYLALAFAIFLIITIISAILGILYAFSNVLGLRNDDDNFISDIKTIYLENNDIESLNIDVAYTNLIVKTGDSLKVETNNNNIQCIENNKQLKIEEKEHDWFWRNNEGDLIIYIPVNIQFNEIEIDTGAGKISIEDMQTHRLDLNLGAGETEIKNLTVTEDCKIESGTGLTNIESSIIKNIDLKLGVGEVNLETLLEGKSEIDAGIGSLNITLQGEKENYKIRAEKGLGQIKVDGNDLSSSQTFGSGENYIEIDGGIGSIDVDFEK